MLKYFVGKPHWLSMRLVYYGVALHSISVVPWSTVATTAVPRQKEARIYSSRVFVGDTVCLKKAAWGDTMEFSLAFRGISLLNFVFLAHTYSSSVFPAPNRSTTLLWSGCAALARPHTFD